MGEQPRDNQGQFTHGLVDSLKQQLQAKGHAPDKAHSLAVEILHAQGAVDQSGKLTPLGEQKQALGRHGRAIGRMARQTGRTEDEMVYDKGARRAFVK